MMFQWGRFRSHSGKTLDWKIECDSLTAEDWDCLARLVAARRTFSRVVGVPRGGLPFAQALERYATPGHDNILLVDDVYTIGQSMETERQKLWPNPVLESGARRGRVYPITSSILDRTCVFLGSHFKDV